ncbi:hypothetical protein [Marinovum sp.]|uniref:hypothetical protein n=1 Tax=Marinovum sp. TaxID=2024839 RepID=UPI002B2714C8|nr:hypothetical protein [Marinovum sp.]
MIARIPEAWRTPVLTVSTVALAMAGAAVVGGMNARDALAGVDLSRKPLDVTVRLPFEPERFHLEAFQEVGRYQGWTEDGAVIRAADPEGLRRLARNYWVDEIAALEID